MAWEKMNESEIKGGRSRRRRRSFMAKKRKCRFQFQYEKDNLDHSAKLIKEVVQRLKEAHRKGEDYYLEVKPIISIRNRLLEAAHFALDAAHHLKAYTVTDAPEGVIER